MHYGTSFMFFERVFPFFFMTIFVLVLGAFAYVILGGLFRFIQNQRSPEVVTEAKVLSKRTEVRGTGGSARHYGAGRAHRGGHIYTRYFITFELTGGVRKEFQVMDKDYGLAIEGDRGRLFYRGTRFQGFDQINQ